MTTKIDITTSLSDDYEDISVWANGEYLITYSWEDICKGKEQLTDFLVKIQKAIEEIGN